MPKPAPLPPGRKRRSITKQDLVANARKAAAGIKVGRPSIYSPELCERAVALGMLGKSWAAIARDFGISRDTLHTWERDNSEFSDAMRRARAAAQAWWEEHGQKNLRAKHYQAQVSRSIMAAQFEDYREVKPGMDVTLHLDEAITEALTRAAQPQASLPGDSAKPIDPLPVVLEQAKARS